MLGVGGGTPVERKQERLGLEFAGEGEAETENVRNVTILLYTSTTRRGACFLRRQTSVSSVDEERHPTVFGARRVSDSSETNESPRTRGAISVRLSCPLKQYVPRKAKRNYQQSRTAVPNKRFQYVSTFCLPKMTTEINRKLGDSNP